MTADDVRFTAVRTTGIYCCPGCTARPLPGNTVTYSLAAAAEAAGFRPCLRCRPYRSAPPRPGGSDLVCRAVSAVLDGMLDRGSEDDLGAEFGLSGRQLRRRFLAELGVTPTDLARSVRAHFARRLLDDTDMAITELAYSAGFSSLRQFNREMRRVFRNTPCELRRRRHLSDRLVTDGGLTTRLPFDGELRWDVMMSNLRPIRGVEAVDGDVYRRTIDVHGEAGVLELSPREPSDVHLTLHLPHWEELVHVVRRARWLLALDDDPRRRPDHIRRWSSHEDELVSALSIDDPTGERLDRFVDAFGAPAPHLATSGLTHLFPTSGLSTAVLVH